jgi:hypothetical protein
LETSGCDPGWTIKAGRIALADSYRHQGAVVRTSHPSLYYERRSKWFQYFPHGREVSLRANNTDRIILTHISTCHHR